MNGYKLAAQVKKANAIASRLRAHHITADEAKLITAEQWPLVAAAAGVKAPSADTVAMVLDALHEPTEAEMDAIFAWAGAQ